MAEALDQVLLAAEVFGSILGAAFIVLCAINDLKRMIR